MCGPSSSPVVPPGLSTCECGTSWCGSGHLAHPGLLPCHASSPLWLSVSAPPVSLDKCFFNSLVVRFPCSLDIWQFGLFFVYKLVDVLLSVVWGSKVYPPTTPSCPTPLIQNFSNLLFSKLDFIPFGITPLVILGANSVAQYL